MQLASDAFISSNPGMLYGGARGGCKLSFPLDMPSVGKEESDPTASVTRDGARATLATSTPIAMAELGDPLVADTLPQNTPDDECLKLTLRNKDGKVEVVKTKKLAEVISDPDHDLVRQWMEERGPGKEGYLPWCKEGDYSKRT